MTQCSMQVPATCHICSSMYGQSHAPACHLGAFTPSIVEHVKVAQVLSSTFNVEEQKGNVRCKRW